VKKAVVLVSGGLDSATLLYFFEEKESVPAPWIDF